MKKPYHLSIEEETRLLRTVCPHKRLTANIDTINSSGLRITLNYYSDNTYKLDITNSRSTRKLKSLVSSEQLVNELQAYGVSDDFIQKAVALNESKLKEASSQNQEEQ